jgi:hypothetical protein
VVQVVLLTAKHSMDLEKEKKKRGSRRELPWRLSLQIKMEGGFPDGPSEQ